MSTFVASLAVAGALLSGNAVAQPAKPTVVLVHGAFADSSSWNGVTRILQKDGYRVVAAANPLRSVSSDAAYISDIVASIAEPVVLVGHSYGGQVITSAANGRDNVKTLVYVAAFAPDEGRRLLILPESSRVARSARHSLHLSSWRTAVPTFPSIRRSSTTSLLTMWA